MASLLAEPLRAQGTPPEPTRPGWTLVRVAKWTLLGTAVAFGGYALSQSTRADRNYADLRTLCRTEPEACEVADGRYATNDAEALYQGALKHDRNARIGIFGGQVALLGSVSLFIYDLRNGRGPVNIPYPSGAGGSAAHTAVGLSVRF